MIDVLSDLFTQCGVRKHVRSDNGPEPVAIVGTHEAKASLAVMQPTEAGAEIALDPPVTHRVPVARLDALGFGAVVARIRKTAVAG